MPFAIPIIILKLLSRKKLVDYLLVLIKSFHTMPSKMEYDKRQVADHKVADDAWMAIHGKGEH